MTTRLTRIQLVVFAIITVLGGAFVGGRYAQIDRLFIDRTFPVSAQFSDSGGIFAGAQVTYRGIEVGRVGKLTFKENGVEARLDIENSAPDIPADVLVVVANKSAIGEQFIDLQPRNNDKPYLKAGTQVSLENTRIPIDTTTLLIDLDNLVSSVDADSLRTVVSEFGQAFEGTGDDLTRILESSNEFINAADDNIDVTRALIQDSRLVLDTQLAKQGQISTFSRNLALVSQSFVNADPDLRRLFDQGTVGARNFNGLVKENTKDLTVLINNFLTAGKPLSENVLGLKATFILYPFLVEGSYSVLEPSEDDPGEYDAAFGFVENPAAPAPCSFAEGGPEGEQQGAASGYRERRDSANTTDLYFPTPEGIDCKVPNNEIDRQPSKTVLNRTAPNASGKDALSWLLLDPVTR